MNNAFQLPILSISIWFPILMGILLMALVRGNGEAAKRNARWMALIISIFEFLITLPLVLKFDRSTSAFQFEESAQWIPDYGINYVLGVDGISVMFILLTSFVTIFAILASLEVIQDRVKEFMVSFLIMGGLMIGVFAALDAVIFYIFWEAMLIPMFIIIGVWGGPKRIYATVKFFLYTFAGSVLMLVALMYMYFQAGQTMSIPALMDVPLTLTEQCWLFVALLIAFAVKVPMFPVHTWLPHAHVQAPTAGSVILAAIMLKMGGYGFLRFSLPMFPDASTYLADVVIVLSLIAVIYTAYVAMMQTDMKRLVAYSSISHMGIVTLGFFVFTQQGIEGGIMQMISHGFVSAALFLIVGVMYDRLHTREIGAYGGVVNSMPAFAALAMVFFMGNVGLPGTTGFVGEIMVLIGTFQVNKLAAVLATTTLVLSAMYTLWLFKRVLFGDIVHEGVRTLKDLSTREWWVLAPLAVVTIYYGLFPNAIFDIMHVSVEHLIDQVATGKM